MSLKNKLIFCFSQNNEANFAEDAENWTQYIFIVSTKKNKEEIEKLYQKYLINLAKAENIQVYENGPENVVYVGNKNHKKESSKWSKILKDHTFSKWLQFNFKCEVLENEKNFYNLPLQVNNEKPLSND